MVSYATDGEPSAWERNPSLRVDEVLPGSARTERARLKSAGARP